jgi:hypothetical protein
MDDKPLLLQLPALGLWYTPYRQSSLGFRITGSLPDGNGLQATLRGSGLANSGLKQPSPSQSGPTHCCRQVNGSPWHRVP